MTHDDEEQIPSFAFWKAGALFLLGGIFLYAGGEAVYQTAVIIAERLDISETIIGLTVVACGTSIPDVMASILATRKHEYSIAVGNLVGSNISNILVVLGGTLIASGPSLASTWGVVGDYIAVCSVSILFTVVALASQRLTRLLSLVMLVAFVGYYVYRVSSAL